MTWRYIPINNPANTIRKRINSSLGAYLIKKGGAYLKYPTINEDPKLFCPDGTHVSTLGYDIMLNMISAGLYDIIFNGSCVYPDNFST